jgi:TolA-binding protein
MKKVAAAGLTALALLIPAASYAQQQTNPGSTTTTEQNRRPTEADLQAITDARIAALRAGLKLTPDQEKNWAPVEQVIREMAQNRQSWMAKRREERKSENAIDRLRDRADAMTQRAAELKKLADAAQPLYQSLSDEQKHRLRFLAAFAMGHEHRGGWHHGYGRQDRG